ncbi:MAG: mitochondrial fission ELM1 family protein [Pseudomonadota bacterium]|nr:mitochondrial fission ELM1 family protein [Pseudomonadota bacterium]MDE3037580.1 mitochondrial fission ELM1 family protein [Pseudomonadota bacterium]
MKCWGITDGSAGMEAQVKALAGALGLSVEMKKAEMKAPWVNLPNSVVAGPVARFIPRLLSGDALTPPWPGIVISCGRRAAAVALGLRRIIPKAKFIHIQDPQVGPRHFDLVVAMRHDRLSGKNVISTRFALHGITPASLASARERFAPLFTAYPAPLVAVLIGGSTNKYTLHPETMAQVVMKLQRLQHAAQCSLLITPSRRTGEENTAMLRNVFAANPRVYIYDGVGENPYFGMLALADAVVVTNDSVNMMTDACATGKPVYILPLPGHDGTKPARFAQNLIGQGIARAIGSKLDTWSYETDDEMGRVAAEVRRRIFPLPSGEGGA